MVFINELEYAKACGIYKIVNTINNKVYIGQTNESFQKRYWNHRWKLNNNSHDNQHLQLSWNKYGADAFIFEVIECIDDSKLLNTREIYWIDIYKSRGLSYNIQPGGQPESLVSYISPDARKRVGKINRERMLGSTLSDETKQKMSAARKGKYYHRKTDVLTKELAFEIKSMLVNGYSTSEICAKLSIPYKHVNNILSNNTWKHVWVDGWEDFRANRAKSKGKTVGHSTNYARQKTEEEIKLIVSTYEKIGNYSKVARELGISRETVKKYVTQNEQVSC